MRRVPCDTDDWLKLLDYHSVNNTGYKVSTFPIWWVKFRLNFVYSSFLNIITITRIKLLCHTTGINISCIQPLRLSISRFSRKAMGRVHIPLHTVLYTDYVTGAFSQQVTWRMIHVEPNATYLHGRAVLRWFIHTFLFNIHVLFASTLW